MLNCNEFNKPVPVDEQSKHALAALRQHSMPGLASISEGACQIVYKFRRNSFACPREFWRAKYGIGVHNYYY